MRIHWIDNLKAIGIFLVVLGHALPDSLIKRYIYSFHVPLFFFISGYLFDRSKFDFGQFFKRKFNILVIPYLFFAILSFLFWFVVVRNLSISGKALAIDPLKPLLGIFYGIGTGDWRVPMNVALWFLPCLFLVELIFFFVKKRAFLIIFMILSYFVIFLPFRLPWSLDVALAAIVFYGLGYFYKDRWVLNKYLPLLLGCHLVFCFLNSPVDMNYLVYGNIFFFFVSAYSGVLFYLGISKFIKKNIILNYVGQNTIIIIGTIGITWFLLNGIYYMIFKTKMDHQTGFAYCFMVSVLQIILTVPAIYIINTWFPFILGRRKSRILKKRLTEPLNG